jgi:hypothetical protein
MTLSSAGAQEGPRIPPDDRRRVYWHRELPPVDAEIMGEHVLEAVSERVQGSLALRDELGFGLPVAVSGRDFLLSPIYVGHHALGDLQPLVTKSIDFLG